MEFITYATAVAVAVLFFGELPNSASRVGLPKQTTTPSLTLMRALAVKYALTVAKLGPFRLMELWLRCTWTAVLAAGYV